MNKVKLIWLLVLLFSLSGCTNFWDKDDDDMAPYKGMSGAQLYKDARKALRYEQYSDAIKKYEALETMYPFSKFAEKSERELIYAYFQKEDYASCAATSERYIHLYPRSDHVDYAYYMKGLSNFYQTRGGFGRIFPMDQSERAPGTLGQAYSDFATLIQKFPQSKYSPNALQRMIYLRNMFAQREMNAANYFYIRKMYVAAIGRANYLIKTYPQAPTAQAALALTYYANMELGLTAAANNALAIYEATYHSKPKPIG